MPLLVHFTVFRLRMRRADVCSYTLALHSLAPITILSPAAEERFGAGDAIAFAIEIGILVGVYSIAPIAVCSRCSCPGINVLQARSTIVYQLVAPTWSRIRTRTRLCARACVCTPVCL